MAKKKVSKKSENDFLPRKDKRSSAQLSRELDDLDGIIGDMRSVLKSMHDSKIDELMIDGIQKLPRSKELLSEFAANVWHALYRARLAMGKTTRLPVSE